MKTPLSRRKHGVRVQVGDLICRGRLSVTMVRNPGAEIGVIVSAVDDAGGVHFMQWNGWVWMPYDPRPVS